MTGAQQVHGSLATVRAVTTSLCCGKVAGWLSACVRGQLHVACCLAGHECTATICGALTGLVSYIIWLDMAISMIDPGSWIVGGPLQTSVMNPFVQS
jgi:hypothetical protein